MMKPEKKKFNSQAKDQAQSDRDAMIYNQAIDEYKKRLPSEEEIEKTINEIEGVVYLEQSEDKIDRVLAKVMRNNHKSVAKTLSNRIRGEK